VTLDKKSIIQLAILLVLVVGGGAAYLTTQEGGLDSVTNSITSLIDMVKGEAEQATASAPSAAPQPVEPAIPAAPAKGQIAGKPFEPDSVAFESGVLALVQSKEPQTAVLVSVPGPKWETPAGKPFKYLPAGAGSPQIVVRRMSDGEMKQQVSTDKYSLVLDFGKEKDKKLAGKLNLEIPGESKVTLAGTFEAEIKGFRFVDGKPDLSADSTDTLQYLALRELLKDDPDKQVEVVALRDARYNSEANGKSLTGYLEVEYRVGQAATQVQRYQFVKDPEWKLRGALALDQIDEAHPLAPPGAKDRPEQQLSYLAAKRLEADLKKKAPKKGIYGTSFVTRHSAKTKIGVAEASYKTEPDGQPLKTAYLFRLGQKGWGIDRELTAKEKVNVDTGKIEKK
jgi:hypothetical protein